MIRKATKRYTRRRFLGLAAKASLAALVLQAMPDLLHQLAGAAPFGALQQLKPRLASRIASYPGTVALSVTDLATGEHISVHGNRPQVGACTINLFLLFSVVEDLQAGRYSTTEVDWIVRAAVGASDPRWGKELVVKTGGGSIAAGVAKINEVMGRIGVTGSFYDHAPEYWSLYSLQNRDNVVTADDLNLALGKLYRGELFQPALTRYALAKLGEVLPRLNNVIPRLLPRDGVRVAHKVGFINYAGYATRNDAALVMVRKGGGEVAYAISFLSQNNANYWAAADFGAQLSREVFDHLGAQHGF